jgi:hypothetical protein
MLFSLEWLTQGRQCHQGEVVHPSLLVLRPVSQIHLNYDRVEEQLKAKQDELAVEREASRAMRNSLAAYNAQMQVFMAVRKKNNFIAFLTFSGM